MSRLKSLMHTCVEKTFVAAENVKYNVTAPGYVPLTDACSKGEKIIVINAVIDDNASSLIPEIKIVDGLDAADSKAALKLRISPLDYKMFISSDLAVRRPLY